MIEKNEDGGDNDENLVRIRLIADKRKFLEDKSSEVREEIKVCFSHLRETLLARENQLLRQVEAIHRQQISLVHSSQDFLPPSVAILDQREVLEEQIRDFGRIEVPTCVSNQEPYRIEEYQDTDKDHMCLDKSIKSKEKWALADEKIGSQKSCSDLNRDTDNCRVEMESTESQDNHEKESEFAQEMDNCSHLVREELEIKDTKQNCKEKRRSSVGHPEQVQQWLEQILLETEIEPTIHEVEKLPEISGGYLCTKFQVET